MPLKYKVSLICAAVFAVFLVLAPPSHANWNDDPTNPSNAAAEAEANVGDLELVAGDVEFSPRSETDFLAIDLANFGTAPTVLTDCHVSRGSLGGLGIGHGGKVSIDEACQCNETALGLLDRGFVAIGLSALQACGVVDVPQALVDATLEQLANDKAEAECMARAEAEAEATAIESDRRRTAALVDICK